MTEELEEYAREKTSKNAQEAKNLLSNRLMVAFFKRAAISTQEAFEGLPYGATIDEYRTVHHRAMAIKDLKAELQSYVNELDLQAYRDKLLERQTV